MQIKQQREHKSLVNKKQSLSQFSQLLRVGTEPVVNKDYSVLRYSHTERIQRTDAHSNSHSETKTLIRYLTDKFSTSFKNIEEESDSQEIFTQGEVLCRSKINSLNENFAIQSQPNELQINLDKYFGRQWSSSHSKHDFKKSFKLTAASKVQRVCYKLFKRTFSIRVAFQKLKQSSTPKRFFLIDQLLKCKNDLLKTAQKGFSSYQSERKGSNTLYVNKLVGKLGCDLIKAQKAFQKQIVTPRSRQNQSILFENLLSKKMLPQQQKSKGQNQQNLNSSRESIYSLEQPLSFTKRVNSEHFGAYDRCGRGSLTPTQQSATRKTHRQSSVRRRKNRKEPEFNFTIHDETLKRMCHSTINRRTRLEVIDEEVKEPL